MSFNSRKQEKDYTAEVKALQPEAEKLASVSCTILLRIED
jgi:26S proteasome regulatory subunit N5